MEKSVNIEKDGKDALRVELNDKGAVHLLFEGDAITIEVMNHVTMEKEKHKFNIKEFSKE